ncbi:hypothetical protein G6F30_009715 [Rhizopus arrhizus]|nr:hypothetical protein G6F30_009715 [Rhizopus arrhizus]
MDHARSSNSDALGLLLDQEKAYDRVHPDYLRQVLLRFGFPQTFVDSILGLFFGTQLRLNVNGFLSNPVHQRRGLRQGDPISPLLFNLAFEPLLRRTLSDSTYQGYSLPRSPRSPCSEPVKLLAYADDVLFLLNDPSDLTSLQEHLSLYSRASNARVNFHKTEALSLSGARLDPDSVWHTPLLSHRITRWHDCRSPQPVIYLGYPLSTSTSQRDRYLETILCKIKSACVLHSQRSLSIRGRVTIVNSLILSKLWHILRVVSVPLSFLDKVRSIVSSFLTWRLFPRIGLATMCLPRSSGGLGVLDPQVQQGALQLRWILPLLSVAPVNSDSASWSSSDITNSIVLPRLLDYMLFHLQAWSPSIISINLDTFDIRLPYMFKDLRPPALRLPNGIFSLFFRCLDMLPKPFDHVVINPQTALQLPISAIILPASSVPLSKSQSCLPCSTAYKFDVSSSRLKPRLRADIHVRPNLTKRFLRLVRHDKVRLAPFFVRACIPPMYASQGPHPFEPISHDSVDASRIRIVSTLSQMDSILELSIVSSLSKHLVQVTAWQTSLQDTLAPHHAGCVYISLLSCVSYGGRYVGALSLFVSL